MAIIRVGNKLETPPTRPSLLLDFANSEVVHNDISFTRSSTATYVGRDQLIKTSEVNEPRISFDSETGECRGLWIEESITNTLPYSASTTGWATEGLSSHTTAGSETLDPAGGTNALKVVETTSTGPHRIYANTVAVNSSQYAWWSVWVKPLATCASDWRVTLESWYSGMSVRQGVFNLFTGEIVSNASSERAFIEKYPNGWYRIGILIGTQATSFRNFYIFSSRDTSRDPTGETDHGFYWWGGQVESMSFGGAYDTSEPTSYIPTSGGSATRSSDVAYLNTIANYLPTVDSKGPSFSMFAEVSIRTANEAARVWQLTGQGARFYDVYASSGTGYPYGLYAGASAAGGIVHASIDSFDKVAARWTSGDNTLYVNGAESADNSQTHDDYDFTVLYIGQNSSGQYLGGFLKKLAVYPTPLTDSQLIELTEI